MWRVEAQSLNATAPLQENKSTLNAYFLLSLSVSLHGEHQAFDIFFFSKAHLIIIFRRPASLVFFVCLFFGPISRFDGSQIHKI